MDDERELEAAVGARLVERRRQLGAPPSAEALRAYRDGRLSGEEREAVVDGIEAFPEAARALLDLAQVPEVEQASGVDPVPEDDVTEGWYRLRMRMVEERARGGGPTPGSQPPDRASPVVSRAGAAGRPPTLVLPAVAAPGVGPNLDRWPLAAALFLALLLGAVGGWWLRSAGGGPPAASPLPSGLVVLAPGTAPLQRGGDLPTLDPSLPQALVLNAAAVEVLPAYRVVLRDATGGEIGVADRVVPTADGLVPLHLPAGYLESGNYSVDLEVSEGPRSPLATYHFEVRPPP